MSDNWNTAYEGPKVYVYEYNSSTNTWNTTAHTVLSETGVGNFGYTVGTSSNSRNIVGTDNNTAYIYEYITRTVVWNTTAVATLFITGATSRVSISENYALIEITQPKLHIFIDVLGAGGAQTLCQLLLTAHLHQTNR